MVRRVFAAASITTTFWELHPRSHGHTTTAPLVLFELATSSDLYIRWIPTKPDLLPGKVLWQRFGLICWALKIRKFSGFPKAASLFFKWQCRQRTNFGNRKQSQHYYFYSLKRFSCFKVWWSLEHSSISAFESLRWFTQWNHPDSLYSSALQDAFHMRSNRCGTLHSNFLRFALALASRRKKGGSFQNWLALSSLSMLC